MGLIRVLKLTVPLTWEMLNYLDANDQMICFEFESLSHNFYSTAKLMYFCGPTVQHSHALLHSLCIPLTLIHSRIFHHIPLIPTSYSFDILIHFGIFRCTPPTLSSYSSNTHCVPLTLSHRLSRVLTL